LVGSSYVAARYLHPRMYAIFMGLTQYLGMLGVAFGSKPVQMAIDPFGLFEVSWEHVWLTFAIIGLVSAAVTWIVMPREQGDTASHHDALSFSSLLQPFVVVFGNLQSWRAPTSSPPRGASPCAPLRNLTP
jgi:hypothetical protein